MKRLICIVLAVGFTAGAASAQTSGSHSARTNLKDSTGNTWNSTGTYKAKSSAKVFLKPSRVLDNRKIFHWETGQISTPTGREAASINGGYQSLKRSPARLEEGDDH